MATKMIPYPLWLGAHWPRLPVRVKLRKTRYEQMSSDLPPTTDIPERGPQGRPSFQIQHSAIVRFAPEGVIAVKSVFLPCSRPLHRPDVGTGPVQ